MPSFSRLSDAPWGSNGVSVWDCTLSKRQNWAWETARLPKCKSDGPVHKVQNTLLLVSFRIHRAASITSSCCSHLSSILLLPWMSCSSYGGRHGVKEEQEHAGKEEQEDTALRGHHAAARAALARRRVWPEHQVDYWFSNTNLRCKVRCNYWFFPDVASGRFCSKLLQVDSVTNMIDSFCAPLLFILIMYKESFCLLTEANNVGSGHRSPCTPNVFRNFI